MKTNNNLNKQENKKYRFFFHYYRQYNKMSIHFKGTCMRAKHVECSVPVETKWNKQQPYLVLQGWAESVEINDNICTIK